MTNPARLFAFLVLVSALSVSGCKSTRAQASKAKAPTAKARLKPLGVGWEYLPAILERIKAPTFPDR